MMTAAVPDGHTLDPRLRTLTPGQHPRLALEPAGSGCEEHPCRFCNLPETD
ncbi:hypothetical protein ARZXY2_4578 (plasmid) [Arthrobacter sp. ZXY-2]|nr:hypothetical protein ARZXY2_4578 [Arthrobacter sp. ZXY-2]